MRCPLWGIENCMWQNLGFEIPGWKIHEKTNSIWWTEECHVITWHEFWWASISRLSWYFEYLDVKAIPIFGSLLKTWTKHLKRPKINLTGVSNINHWELQIHKIDYLIGFKRPIFVSILCIAFVFIRFVWLHHRVSMCQNDSILLPKAVILICAYFWTSALLTRCN